MIGIAPSSSVGTTPPSSQQQKLEQAAQAFEAIFVRNMMSAMRKASIGDDLLGSSNVNQFRDMMDEQIAEDMAKHQGLGIAEHLIDQWKNRL